MDRDVVGPAALDRAKKLPRAAVDAAPDRPALTFGGDRPKALRACRQSAGPPAVARWRHLLDGRAVAAPNGRAGPVGDQAVDPVAVARPAAQLGVLRPAGQLCDFVAVQNENPFPVAQLEIGQHTSVRSDQIGDATDPPLRRRMVVERLPGLPAVL